MTNPLTSIAHALATLAHALAWAVDTLGWWLVVVVLAWPLVARLLWAMTPAYEFGKRMGVRSTAPGMVIGGIRRGVTGRLPK